MTDELVPALTRLLDRALRRVGELGEAGDRDYACQVAAQAWALLDRPFPKEAQRLQGTLHYLTLVAPNRPRAGINGARVLGLPVSGGGSRVGSSEARTSLVQEEESVGPA